MNFYSTTNKSIKADFKTALFQGLASDGGLFMPDLFPQFNPQEIQRLPYMSLQEIGTMILDKWIGDTIPKKNIRQIITKALNFPMPIKQVGPFFVLELFHGPTLAFKDVAARVLAQLFEYYLEKEKRNITILVATSGDTGGAMAQAFSGLERVKLVIFYPYKKISKLQEEQLTRAGRNVTPIAIKGVFDDCQKYVKQAFQDNKLQTLHLTSANSINIGRLIPQIIYYAWAFAETKKDNLQFVVPSGNMGNATATLFAYKMAIPISSIVIATNENDAAVKYFKTGKFSKQKTIKTLSTAMDIGNPSNFERILATFDYSYSNFKKLIQAVRITDKETVKTIKKVYEKYNYLMDFHTAVGFATAEKLANESFTLVIVATASPVKFASEIKKTVGIEIDNSKILKNLRGMEKREYIIENNYQAVKDVLLRL